jgi:hypothetical protein
MSAATQAAQHEQAEAAAGTTARVSSPYVGLVPFSERDAEFFFGRAEESRDIAARLRGTRLTLLYGPSGVGKSSVLRAGVFARLIEIARHDLAERGVPDFAVVFFSEWAADPLGALSSYVRESVRKSLGQEMIDSLPPGLTLTQILKAWTERYGIELLIILDQFEEYFLYHGDEGGPGTFAHQFPEAVNQSDLRARFLISMRDDTLSKLDRFKGSVPTLFDNRLQIEHLYLASAYEAVVGPVDKYNELFAKDAPFRFDHEFDEDERALLRKNVLDESKPFLLNKVLSEVQVGKLSIGVTGQGIVKKNEESAAARGPQPRAAVEAPYLQLVMTRIWRDEETAKSRELKAATLEKLGGSQKIIELHLDNVMEGLSEEDQDAAAAVFYYLVTPSGTKIAHTVKTLAEYAKLPQERVSQLVESLLKVREKAEEKKDKKAETKEGGKTEEKEAEEYRILRRVNQGLGKETIESYEVYHDALAPAILAWSAKHKSEQEQRRALEAAFRKSLRRMLWVIAILLVGLGAIYLLYRERSRALEKAVLGNEARQKQKSLEANAKTLQSLVSLTRASTPAEEKSAAIKVLQEQIQSGEIDPKLAPLIQGVLSQIVQIEPQTQVREEAADTVKQITQQAQDTSISPRVYIHIQGEDQRAIALYLQDELNTSQLTDIPNVRQRIIAPGIQKVGLRRNIEVSELRYFHDTKPEKQIGEQLVKILNDAGLADVQLKLIGGYESNPDIRPNHFELWLSADVR